MNRDYSNMELSLFRASATAVRSMSIPRNAGVSGGSLIAAFMQGPTVGALAVGALVARRGGGDVAGKERNRRRKSPEENRNA